MVVAKGLTLWYYAKSTGGGRIEKIALQSSRNATFLSLHCTLSNKAFKIVMKIETCQL